MSGANNRLSAKIKKGMYTSCRPDLSRDIFSYFVKLL